MITFTPGDPVQIMLGDVQATPEQISALRRDMGLDQPFLERFLGFLVRAIHGDFGISFFHRRPVIEVMGERLPATIELTLFAAVAAFSIAIPLGVAAAVYRGSKVDRIATVASLFGVSMPGFWFGILLIMFFAVNLHLLPAAGRIA